MLTIKNLRALALSFPEVTEEPHFEKTSFRVKRKIFVTFDQKNNRATIKLSEIDQNVFSLAPKGAIHPVDNKWGKQGWTFIELDSINKDLFHDAITTTYCHVAPKKLAELVRPTN